MGFSTTTSPELTRPLRSKNCADNTTRILHSRLVKEDSRDRESESVGRSKTLATVSREAFVRAESESVMDRRFGEAGKPLLVHSGLSAQDVENL